MRESIDGPDCTNPSICKGDCCSIEIGVPKALAEELINNKYANEDDFIRSNTFSFKLRFNDETAKCFLFDEKINGCSVHFSGIKPPQCWIYPTDFSHHSKETISCKKVGGWKIIKPEKTRNAEKLFQKYLDKCKEEAHIELLEIDERMGLNKNEVSNTYLHDLKIQLMNIAPSHLAGLMDSWSFIQILPAEGYSLQLRKICLKHCPSCNYMKENFLDCKNICSVIADILIQMVQENLPKYINKEGLSANGQYPLYKLFQFLEK